MVESDPADDNAANRDRKHTQKTHGHEVAENSHSAEAELAENPGAEIGSTKSFRNPLVDTSGEVTSDHEFSFAHRPTDLPKLDGYEVLGVVGRGGMGVVYKARQIALNRLVALKMILSGQFASPVEIQRFRAEAENTAHLDHPHILPVYEVGALHGQQYFSMKLIEGCNLSQYLSNCQPQPLAAAKLLANIADAVHYAHQHGVLHRDLKPGNILLSWNELVDVDAKKPSDTPESWPSLEHCVAHVSDFGLAKRVDIAGDQTQTGAVLGTPNYMAPEQAAGKNDRLTTAVDVYALGAILYVMLTGRPPFQAETPQLLLRQVESHEPTRPSRIANVPRDLEKICLKCLEKEPQLRYASANALAEDLRRFVAGKPVEARPLTSPARLWRWCRRQPALAGMGTVVALFLLSFPTTIAVLQHDANLRLLAEQARTEQQRREADANFRQARDAVNTYLSEIYKDRRLMSSDFHDLRIDLLKSGLPFFQQLTAQQPSDHRLQAEQGAAFLHLALIMREIGSYDESLDYNKSALSIFERLARQHPSEDSYKNQVAESYRNRGGLYLYLAKWEAAAADFEKARLMYVDLSSVYPRKPAYQHSLSGCLIDLGNAVAGNGRASDAELEFLKALQIHQQLVDKYPETAQYRAELAGIYFNLALLYSTAMRGRLQDAETGFRLSLKLRQQLVDEHSDDAEYREGLAQSHHRLAALLRSTQRFAEANELFQSALKLQEALVDDHLSVPQYREDLAFIYSDLIGLYQLTGSMDDAENACRKAIELREQLTQQHPQVAAYAFNLGNDRCRMGDLLRNQSKFSDACQWYDQAIRNVEAALPHVEDAMNTHDVHVSCYSGRAQALAGLGQYDKAVMDWDRVFELGAGFMNDWAHVQRALARVRLRGHAEATAEIEEVLASQKSPQHALMYTADAARVLSIAAKMAAEDQSDLDQAEQLESHYASRAMELLSQGSSGHFQVFDLQNLEHDRDWDSLRQREDFERLLNDLRERSANTP